MEEDVKSNVLGDEEIGFCFYCLLGLPCPFAEAEKAEAEKAEEKEAENEQ